MSRQPVVAVVDDDESLREALRDLLIQVGLSVRTFASAEEFLTSDHREQIDCLILDVALPRMSGPSLQQELRRSGHLIPTIFVTAHEDARLRAGVLEAGAVDYLLKPFDDAALLSALSAALGVDPFL